MYITCYNVNYFVSQPVVWILPVGLDFVSVSGFCQWVWIEKPHRPDSLLYHLIYTQPWHKYADDTTLQASDPDLSVLEQNLNEDLESLSKWLNENRLVLNTDKRVCMILGTHQCRVTLTLNLKVRDKPIYLIINQAVR